MNTLQAPHRGMLLAGVLPALLLMVVPAQAQWQRIIHDGFTADWAGWPVLAADAVGDATPDLIQLQACRDENSVTFRLVTGNELLLQEDFPIRLILDTDSNPATGTPVEGLGAELVWTFSSKSGSYRHGTGTTITVRHDDLGLRALPAWSATDFEIRLDLDARPDGSHLLFPAESVRVVVSQAGGDRLPVTGHATVDLGAGSLPAFPVTPLPRPGDGSLRLAAWNVLSGRIFDTSPSVTAAYDRILTALAPDVIAFAEIWDQSAAQLVTRLNQLVPEQGPWTAVKLDPGNIIAARFPIRQSWLVQAGYRETAALVDVSAVLGDSLLFIATHLRCCSANTERQEEADGLVQFLHNARNPGGAITLRAGTPMVLAGDFNLVGDGQQYSTLMTGDIVDNAGYGPDSPPDWDGGALADLVPLHPDRPEAATWWDNGSTFSPGRLDMILYTDSVLEALRGGVVATPLLAPVLLADWGLQAGDAWTASDHFAVWGDFRLPVAQPDPPQVGIQRLGDGTLRLDWPAVPGAAGYRVELADALGGEWAVAGQTSDLSWPLAAPVGGQHALLRVVALP